MRVSSVSCAYSQVCDVIADVKALRDNSDQEFLKKFKRPQKWDRSIIDKCVEATLKRLVLKSTTGFLSIMP